MCPCNRYHGLMQASLCGNNYLCALGLCDARSFYEARRVSLEIYEALETV